LKQKNTVLVSDKDIVAAAEAVAARRGHAAGEQALRSLRGTVEASKRNPLTEDEAMALADGELRALRAERLHH
jgi:hypothetical protein